MYRAVGDRLILSLHLTQVEIDEAFRFVRHIRPEVAPNDAVPRSVVLLVKFLLDICGDILQGNESKSKQQSNNRSVKIA